MTSADGRSAFGIEHVTKSFSNLMPKLDRVMAGQAKGRKGLAAMDYAAQRLTRGEKSFEVKRQLKAQGKLKKIPRS